MRLALAAENIDARPVWIGDSALAGGVCIAMRESVGGEVAEDLFTRGLCLPSGSNLTEEELARVVKVIRGVRR